VIFFALHTRARGGAMSAAVQAETWGEIWENRRHRLLSWWDMRTFPLSDYLRMVRGFQEMLALQESEKDFGYTSDLRGEVVENLGRYAKDADKYGLEFTAAQFRRMEQVCMAGCTHAELMRLVPDALNRIEDECRGRLMVMVDSKYLDYIGDAQLFDSSDRKVNKVSVHFPSAGEDIAESGICLALGRSTACVMHLSRVLEVGLQVLANAVNVGKQNDWGKYLKGIDDELQKRMKTSGARSSDEQFYAEAYACFDAIRRAWRNPTMHVDKTYTTERAEEILISVRSFMRHLATKLHE
jgi:hypothetical protein